MKKILFMMCVAIAMASCGNANDNMPIAADALETQIITVPMVEERVTVSDVSFVKEDTNQHEYKVVTLSNGKKFRLVENRILGLDNGAISYSNENWQMYCSLRKCQVGDQLVKFQGHYYLDGLECYRQPVFTVINRVVGKSFTSYVLDNGAEVILFQSGSLEVQYHDGYYKAIGDIKQEILETFEYAVEGTKAVYVQTDGQAAYAKETQDFYFFVLD